jgi:hypothetical protein
MEGVALLLQWTTNWPLIVERDSAEAVGTRDDEWSWRGQIIALSFLVREIRQLLQECLPACLELRVVLVKCEQNYVSHTFF